MSFKTNMKRQRMDIEEGKITERGMHGCSDAESRFIAYEAWLAGADRQTLVDITGRDGVLWPWIVPPEPTQTQNST